MTVNGIVRTPEGGRSITIQKLDSDYRQVAGSRIAGRFRKAAVNQVINDMYSAGVTTADLSAAARDLVLTPGDAAACENPEPNNLNQE